MLCYAVGKIEKIDLPSGCNYKQLRILLENRINVREYDHVILMWFILKLLVDFFINEIISGKPSIHE